MVVVTRRSMAARRAARRVSLPHALPHDMAVEIAGRVAATSPRPVADLRSLRASCRAMRAACGDRDVGRRVALEREAGDMRWSDQDRFLAVVGSLSAAGNPEACFLAGIALAFGHDGCARAGNELLAQAAAAGHRVAAYVLALLLYRAGGGGDASDAARQLVREVEGEGEAAAAAGGDGGCKTTDTRRSNVGCVRCRAVAVEAVRQATWKMAKLPASDVPVVAAAAAPPPPPEDDGGHRCTVSGCGKPEEGWCDWAVFCSEECRIKNECNVFFSQLPLTIANLFA